MGYATDALGLELFCIETTSDSCSSLVKNGTASLGIVTGNPDGKDFRREKLIDAPLCCIMAANHPLADKPMISFQQLAESDFVVPPDTNFSLKQLVDKCAACGFEVRFADSCTLSSAVSALQNSFAVSVAPFGISEFAENHLIEKPFVSEDSMTVPLWLIWQAGGALDSSLDALKSFITETMREGRG